MCMPMLCARAAAPATVMTANPPKPPVPPVLEAIGHAGLSDVIVVVTRYFGGILLGTGGLVRAYTAAASGAFAAGGDCQHAAGDGLRRDRAIPQV